MSDTPSPPSAVPPPSVAPASAPAKPPKRRRTWGQRFKILVLLLLIGVCLFRIALNFALPTVIDRVARLYGLECGYQRLSLSLSGGQAHLYGLQVRPAEGGPVLATCDYLQGDLSVLQLLRGRLVVFRAEVDGADVTVERTADGRIPLLEKFVAAKQQIAATQAAATQPAGPGKPFSLDAPLRVDAVRLSHLTAHLKDRSVTPNFEANVRTSLRVSDVGVANAPAHFELDVTVDPLLDILRVTGEATTSPAAIKADARVLLRGLHPKAAAGYLAAIGLRGTADSMTVQANLSLAANTLSNTSDLQGTLTLDHVTAVADGEQWASLESLRLLVPRAGANGIKLAAPRDQRRAPPRGNATPRA